MPEQIVWLVDENKSELKLSGKRIKKILPKGAILETIHPPLRAMSEYIPIIEDIRTICIILDQKLKNTGYANYTGIELALYLREQNPIIPIFILTNYPDDITANGWGVEDVLQKDDFYSQVEDETGSHILRERLSRRIAAYTNVINQTETRFSELLLKSIENDLSDDEREEFEALGFFRTKPTMTRELEQLAELEKIVDQHKRFLDEFREAKIDSESKE